MSKIWVQVFYCSRRASWLIEQLRNKGWHLSVSIIQKDIRSCWILQLEMFLKRNTFVYKSKDKFFVSHFVATHCERNTEKENPRIRRRQLTRTITPCCMQRHWFLQHSIYFVICFCLPSVCSNLGESLFNFTNWEDFWPRSLPNQNSQGLRVTAPMGRQIETQIKNTNILWNCLITAPTAWQRRTDYHNISLPGGSDKGE